MLAIRAPVAVEGRAADGPAADLAGFFRWTRNGWGRSNQSRGVVASQNELKIDRLDGRTTAATRLQASLPWPPGRCRLLPEPVRFPRAR